MSKGFVGRSTLSAAKAIAILGGAAIAGLAAAVVQHLITGDVSPAIAGAIAGGVSAVIYVMLRRRRG